MDRNEKLSYRERQLMDILYKLGEASASQVMEAMPDPPGFSSVRKWLFILEGKNLITHRKEGRQFLYTPAIPRERAMKKAIDRLAEVFFEGSKARAAATFLREAEQDLTPDDLREIRTLIEDRRREGES